MLLHEQADDVKFAEDRFAKANGHGVMFTNGTGTGKTFSGLGIIKRLERQGKTNILIVTPQANVLNAWIKSGKHFQLNISSLKNTQDAGKGVVVTTYANFGQNTDLVNRQWDAVVFDEAHYLNSNQTGEATNAQGVMRAITLHPGGAWRRAAMLHPELLEEFKTTEGAAQEVAARKWREANDAVREEVAAAQSNGQRSKVVFLSATPFAYDKNIDYAEGYLFDYGPEDTSGGYNSGSAHDRFFMRHFGYRMRYNKLTEPEAAVDQGLMQRQFNSWMKQEGVLSGRMLSVDHDYDRKFVLVESAIGRKIDEGLDFLRDNSAEYSALYSRIMKSFDYLHRRYLLEAIKAKEVIPIIKQHLALNRKVVVFHDYNQGGGINPFDVRKFTRSTELVQVGTYPNQSSVELGSVARAFLQTKLGKELSELPFASYGSALDTLAGAFPGALQVNGNQNKTICLKAEELFQDHSSGKNLIIVQADKGKEGISLHDTVGDMPRVLINLGLPVKPTQAIQQEGRIFRVGQASNAMFRYLNTGTNWERWAFATTIARRASTAENLAMGESARMLLDAFVEAYQDSDTYPAGHEGEGTGGVERDRAANTALTEWDRATTFYFAQQKKTSRNKAAEGIDYFPTPEPLALKMVEWADVLPGEAVLEPSAGHGAIARFFPDTAKRRAIEPSLELTSRLGLIFDGDIVQSRFEDHNIVNKYDAIVMNPPFGTASKTAFEHIEKAAQHLRDKGRIVALIPSGPASDKRLEKMLYEEKVEKIAPVGEYGGVSIYAGDAVRVYVPREHIYTLNLVGDNPATVVRGSSRLGHVYVKFSNGRQFEIKYDALTDVQPTGKREKKTTSDLTLVADIKLPSVTFERAGTKVNAHIIVLDKNRSDDGSSTRRRDYTAAETITDFFERIRDAELPGRERTSQSNAEVETITPQAVNQQTGAVSPDLSAVPVGLELAQFPHSKTGATMFVAAMKERLPSEQYAELVGLAKQNGGYYSSYKGGGAIPGFLFKTAEDRQKFVAAASKSFVEQHSAMEKGEVYGILDQGETSYAVTTVLAADRTNDYAARRAGTASGVDGNVDAAGVREQLGLFAPATPKPDTDLEKPLEKVTSKAEGRAVRVVAGTFHSPLTHIKSNEDAARVAWPMAKRAQEAAIFIVTDKKDKILGVVVHSTGTLNQSLVNPRDISGVVLDIPGAANVYFAHNHPTGDPGPSQADRLITERVVKPFAAAGINLKASVIVGFGGDWHAFNPLDYYDNQKGVVETAEPRGVKLDSFDREIVALSDSERITAPSQFAPLRTQLFPGKTGVCLVDGKNRVVGFVPMAVNEMQKLSTKSKATGAGKIMHRIHETNAAALILSIDDIHNDRAAVSNVVNFGNVLDAKVLDAIDLNNISMAARGAMPAAGDAFYSTASPAPAGVAGADLERFVAAANKLSKVQMVALQSSRQLPAEIQADMRQRGIRYPEGVTWQDDTGKTTIYYVADNIDGMGRMQALMRHEWFHAGVADRELDALYKYYQNKNPQQLEQIAARREFDLATVDGRRQAAGELAAQEAEKGKLNLYVRQIIAKIKAWLRSVGVTAEFGNAEVADIIRQAIARVTEQTGYAPDNMLQPAYMTAWHGSPHDHDGFSTEYIGEGEGNQAYGWGMYFAGAKSVAEYYRDILSRGNSLSMDELENYFQPGRIIQSFGGQDKVVSFNRDNWREDAVNGRYNAGWSVTVYHVDKDGNRKYGPEGKNRTHFTMPSAKEYEKVTGEKPRLGRLYQVELAPTEDEYLLWDKPLSEQSEKVKSALVKGMSPWMYVSKYEGLMIKDGFASDGEYLPASDYENGALLYRKLSQKKKGDKAASEYLHSLGIRGVKYLDASSRGVLFHLEWADGGKGDNNVKHDAESAMLLMNEDKAKAVGYLREKGKTAAASALESGELVQRGVKYNYVIFNDADVQIKAKYSVADKPFNFSPAARRAAFDAASELSQTTVEAAASFVSYRDAKLKAAGYEVQSFSEQMSGQPKKLIAATLVKRGGEPLYVVSRVFSDRMMQMDKVFALKQPSGFTRVLYEIEKDAAERYLTNVFGHFVNEDKITTRLFEEIFGGIMLDNDDPESTWREADFSAYKKNEPISTGYLVSTFNPTEVEVRFDGSAEIPYYYRKSKEMERGGSRNTPALNSGTPGPVSGRNSGPAPQPDERRGNGLHDGNGQLNLFSGKIDYSIADQGIAEYAKTINSPAKVVDMTKQLFELLRMSIPERLKASVGKVLSNPWFGSEGNAIRREIVNLNLERGQQRNAMISDLFQASEGYTGVEGLDNLLKDATKEERKLFNDLIKYGDLNDVGKTFTRDELYRGKTKFGKVPDKVVKAYKAFHEVMNAANRVRFQQLEELTLLPYADQEWYDDLLALLNRNMERMAGLSDTEAGEFYRLVRSLKRDLTDEQLTSGENPAKIKASAAVIAAYRDFWRQVDRTERKQQGNMLSAFRDILGARGEIKKMKNEWGHLKGYAPRNRKDGDWHVSVFTTGDDGARRKVYMKPTITEAGAQSHVREVKADLAKHLKENFDDQAQYEVEYERNAATPSELMAWKGSEVAVEALLNTAFDRAGINGKMSAEQWAGLKHEVFQQIAKEIMAQGFGRHGIAREKTLVEGYDDTDYQTVVKEYISGMSGWLSKMRFAIETTREAKKIGQADPSDKVWVNDYVQDAMKNSTYLDELAATARGIGAVYYLGFKVSSAMLNAFQNYTVGQAELSRIMKKAGLKGSAMMMLGRAQKDVMKDFVDRKRGGSGILTDEEHEVLVRAVREGTAQAQAVRMISGSQEMGFGSSWKKFTELSMTPFQFVEQRLNREPAVLAAYRAFKTTAAGEFDAAAYKTAEEFVNSTHYVMGKENMPEMVRKLGAVGKTAYLFQGYVHNYLLWMYNRAKHGEFEAIARSLGAVAALGGVFALPGADDLDKWMLKWFGVSYKMKFKEAMRRNLGTSAPSQALQNFINHGVTSVGGVDMSRAVAVNIPFISDPDKSFGDRIGGAWSGLLKKPGMALSAAHKGDYLRALENIVPEFAANPLRAARQYGQGATTMGGKPIFDETGKQMKYSAGDVVKKSLGFQPLAINDKIELKGVERNLNSHWKERRDDTLAAVRRAKDAEQMREAVRGVMAFNTELRGSQAFGLVPIIKAESVQKSRTFKPNKKTLAWERNRLDPAAD